MRLELAYQIAETPSRKPGRQGLGQKDEVQPIVLLPAVTAQGRHVAEDLADEKPRRIGELVDDAAQFAGKRERVRMV